LEQIVTPIVLGGVESIASLVTMVCGWLDLVVGLGERKINIKLS
jgi:hypothetical protein